MSSPRTKSKNTPQPLSDTEIAQIATEIADGRPPMVWFTAAAVGIPEGRSGKVIALGEPSDGDFLQIRPTGSKDVLSFSPAEVTMTKPARDKAVAQPKSTTRKESPTVTKPSAPTSTASTPPAPQPAPKPAAKPASAPEAAASNGAAKPAPARQQPATPAPAKPAAKAPARKSKAAEVTVTISGTADGEWSVDVVNGKKRTVRALPVNSTAVAQAAKLLHPEVSEVVGGIMEAVRVAQLAKVEQLQAELEEAKKLLAELPD